MSAPDATRPVGAGSVLSGRYRLVRLIAHGGMASVWEAQDNVLARAVAVKMLHPHLAADRLFLERFRREAVSAARLAHPNVVATFDAGVTPDGVAYIVMELIRGRTLSAFQAEHHPVPGTACIEIGIQIADALAHAHAAGLVHRDIKPANVLVCDTGRDGNLLVKVTDFGIAKAAEGLGLELTKTGMILGTPKYLSPEQIEGREPDARADIYALGVVMFELVAGVPPFQGATEMVVAVQHLNQPAPRLRDLRPNVPPALDALVDQMLAKRPEERPSSALAVRQGLAAIGAQLRTNRPSGPVPFAVAPPPGSPDASVPWSPPGSVPGSPPGSVPGSPGFPAGPALASPPGSLPGSALPGSALPGSPPGSPPPTWRPATPWVAGHGGPPGQPAGPPSGDSPGQRGRAATSALPGTVLPGRNGGPVPSRSGLGSSRDEAARSRPAQAAPRHGATGRPAPTADRSSRPRRPNWAGRVVAALVVAALVVLLVVVGDRGSGKAHSPGTVANQTPVAIPIKTVSVFHLERDADDEANVGLVIDGDPNTSWETDRYFNASFAGLRHGLGLAFTLSSKHTLHHLIVTSSTEGWSAEVFVAGAVPSPPSLAPWGSPVAVQNNIQGSTVFNLGAHQGSAILLWITYLGPTFQTSIAEVSVN